MLAALMLAQDAIYQEPLRPQFHFTAQAGWLNDPNGLVYENGEYHLFFQHNPSGTSWGNMTWGHAVSPDLVHWRQLANAIEPDERGTIFSGSAVTDPDNSSGLNAHIIAFYTSAGGTNAASKGQPFTQGLAYSRDHGRTWTKLPKPILGHIEAENRDPKVSWHQPSRHWVMALYLSGDDFALFTSKNLRDWTQIQRLTMPGSNECPDLFEMAVKGSKERRWVFTGANGRYWVGTFDGVSFRPMQEPLAVEFGANNYAVQTYFGLAGDRRVQIGWMRDGRYPEMPFNQQMTFPCELTLRRVEGKLRLYRYPVHEIESLWTDAPQSDLLDIECTFVPSDEPVTLAANGVEIVYDPRTQVLSALGRAAFLAPERGRIALRVLVDRTSVEVFGNGGRVSLSTCKLPAPNSPPILTGKRGSESLTVRTLKRAW